MKKRYFFLALILPLAACDVGPDKSRDTFIDRKSLTELKAGIWIDPNGCDHWIIDDGLEGYLSARLAPDGTPVCSGSGIPNTTVGDFKQGQGIPDFL